VLILDMIEVLPPLGKYKYDTWRILSVKCYIDNFVYRMHCMAWHGILYFSKILEEPRRI
jgi:hypothetical protein